MDLENPNIYHNYYGPTSAIDHNIYIKGSTFYMANYTAGMRVVDIENIEEKVMDEIGFFDTYVLDNSTNYYGVWNVYPFFSSGIIVISDINLGLFLVKSSDGL